MNHKNLNCYNYTNLFYCAPSCGNLYTLEINLRQNGYKLYDLLHILYMKVLKFLSYLDIELFPQNSSLNLKYYSYTKYEYFNNKIITFVRCLLFANAFCLILTGRAPVLLCYK